MNKILETCGLCVAYDNREVLSDVNLTLCERDFVGVIGPNGGGKTTLVRTLLRLLQPTRGTVKYFRDGKQVESLRMGYLPQYSQIDRRFPITVREVVESGLLGEHPEVTQQSIGELMHFLDIEALAQKPIGDLSGGQLQRALLGRAMVAQPELLILDEPNTYLDGRSTNRLYDLLGEVNRHAAILLVSHDVGSVLHNVRQVACVARTLHFHPSAEVTPKWLEAHLGYCPFDLVTHGALPHRVYKWH